MPQVVAQVWVPVPPDVAFAVSQTTGATRLAWDPFIRAQHLIDADRPGKGVRTATRSRVGPFGGFTMISRYVSYRPPTSVGMTMERGPWFFASFGGGWRFEPESRDGVDGTTATWKYTYAIRPRALRHVAEPIGQRLLSREIRARIEAFRRACEEPAVLRTALEHPLVRTRQVHPRAQGCCATAATSRRKFCPTTDKEPSTVFQGHNDR